MLRQRRRDDENNEIEHRRGRRRSTRDGDRPNEANKEQQ